MAKKPKLSTEPYKGVRDFYPEDMRVQNYMYGIMRDVVRSYGYEEYSASPLEYTELYTAKSGQEIAEEQTYSFTDKGDRAISLRPEMTPTAARMVARRIRELQLPLRWFSLPNVFRYESPQKGRLREHIQLNVDLFGGVAHDADREMISLIHRLMTGFGAETTDFTISISDRKILSAVFDALMIPEKVRPEISRSIDRMKKVTEQEFLASLEEHMTKENALLLKDTLASSPALMEMVGDDHPAMRSLVDTIQHLSRTGITNVYFDPSLVRGFDYYTDTVFEVFDTDPSNTRSLFGGGRYDSLVGLFSDRDIPAVGFGVGDVTLRSFLENHNLLPPVTSLQDIIVCRADQCPYTDAEVVAECFRRSGYSVEIDTGGKKLGDQLKRASKKNIPFAVILGPDEVSSGSVTARHLPTEGELKASFDEILVWMKNLTKGENAV